VPREPFEGSVRLRGAAVWAAYGTLEALFAILTPLFLPPDDRYTLLLLLLYPLIGALLGRFAVAGLAIAFAANAVCAFTGPQLAVPLVSAAIVIALFRRSPWIASLLLLAPLWIARELAFAYSFRTKALLAAGTLVAVMLLGFLSAKLRWSLKPPATLTIFLLMMLGAMFVNVPPPRDLAPAQPPPRVASPNILLIVMDTVRADHLPIYGYSRNTTPHLAQFAKSATLYSRAYATSNMTLPSHASLFTGLFASEHTAHYDAGWTFGRPLPARALTAAEILGTRGYATACIAANAYLGEAFGLDQGFQYLDMRPPWMPFGIAANFYLRSGVSALISHFVALPRRARLLSADGADISDVAIRYLDRATAKRRPFFLVLNYVDAHHPYMPPAPYDAMFPGRDTAQRTDLEQRLIDDFTHGKPSITPREREHLISQYDGAIAYEDAQIDRVIGALRARGVYDSTRIIILADHGESFGEHGVITHGLTNYDHETRVPLIVKEPGQTTGDVVTTPVSLLRTWPMLSSLAAPSAIITESFPMRGPDATLPSRRAGTAKIEGTLKTIVNIDGSVESYDLAADPGETHNLAPNANSQRMAAEIAAWRASLRKIDAAAPANAIDPEMMRRLRALGYVR